MVSTTSRMVVDLPKRLHDDFTEQLRLEGTTQKFTIKNLIESYLLESEAHGKKKGKKRETASSPRRSRTDA